MAFDGQMESSTALAAPQQATQKPQKPRSSYLIFCDEFRKVVLEELRGDNGQTPQMPKVAKVLGERWKALDSDVKAKYTNAALQERSQLAQDLPAVPALQEERAFPQGLFMKDIAERAKVKEMLTKAVSSPDAVEQQFVFSGCQLRKELNGSWAVVEGFQDYLEHDRPTYKQDARDDKDDERFCYYWNVQEEGESGWCIGVEVGGEELLGFNPNASSQNPPSSGWKIQKDGSLVPDVGGFALVQGNVESDVEPSQEAVDAKLNDTWAAMSEDERRPWVERCSREAARTHESNSAAATAKGNAKNTPRKRGREETATPESPQKTGKPARLAADAETNAAKGLATKRARAPANTQAPLACCMGEEVLQRADHAGMRSQLLNLAGRPELGGRGLSDETLFAALRKTNGLVNAAKHALLSTGT